MFFFSWTIKQIFKAMLVLFETPAGYALFSANEKKLSKVDNIYQHFATADGANEVLVDL